MKTLVLFLTLVLALIGGGCASMAPYFVDPGVYKGERDAAIAERQSRTAYHKTQTESYRVGQGGVVATAGVKSIPPGEYHEGYLVNLRPEPVVFTITGPVNLTVSLPAAIKPADRRQAIIPVVKPINLLCNRTYSVEIRQAGGQFPYSTNPCWYINKQRGDGSVAGIDADSLQEALVMGMDLPPNETLICDFSALAP